ncbi:hypothetical protein GCM10023080_056760 [Streptomyces pseudoechinosporeus]
MLAHVPLAHAQNGESPHGRSNKRLSALGKASPVRRAYANSPRNGNTARRAATIA